MRTIAQSLEDFLDETGRGKAGSTASPAAVIDTFQGYLNGWAHEDLSPLELLHKKHGAQGHNSRRAVHTPAFRADERRFYGYAEADGWIGRLAKRYSFLAPS